MAQHRETIEGVVRRGGDDAPASLETTVVDDVVHITASDSAAGATASVELTIEQMSDFIAQLERATAAAGAERFAGKVRTAPAPEVTSGE